VTVVSPAKTAEPIEMPFGLTTLVGAENYGLDGGSDLPCEGSILGGRSGGCKVTILSMCGGDAAFCQITLTTYYFHKAHVYSTEVAITFIVIIHSVHKRPTAYEA